MRIFFCLSLIALMAFSGIAYAAGPVTAPAGKFTVEINSRPSPPVVGENLLVITVKEGDKPLSGANVDVHLDMTNMPMPADFKASPGTNEGEYSAAVSFSMAGPWKIDVAVQQMAGMKMDGDGTAHFLAETGKGITAQGGRALIPWFTIFALVIIAAVIAAIIFYKRIPPRQRGYVVGILTLLVVYVATAAIVKKYRDPKTATVIGSAFMDMSAQAAPGTIAVNSETVHPALLQASARYTGTVVPDLEEDVYPRVTGRLISMPFYPGDKISPGQVIAKLDSTELSAKEAQAVYGSIGAQQGISAANADVASSRAMSDKAQKGVAQAQAQLAQVQASARGADKAIQAAQADIIQAEQRLVQTQSEVETAKADAVYWEAEIAREQKLYDQGAISREELERETAQAAASRAKVKQAEAAVRSAKGGVEGANARLEQAQAEQTGAQARIIEAQAAVESSIADQRVAAAGVAGAQAKASMATSSAMQARAALTEAATVRGYTTIRSSVGGVVTARNISPGVLVEPGMSILKIAKIDAIRIQANVSEADLANVRLGQMMTAYPTDSPGMVIGAPISAIFPSQDTSTHTAIVEARVRNSAYNLKPGQYLSVNLPLGDAQRSVLSVPTSALIVRDGQISVYLVVNDGFQTVAKRVMVTTGRASNDRTEVLSGIKDDDEVITSGLANLRDGDAVSILKKTESLPASPATDNHNSIIPTTQKSVTKATSSMAMPANNTKKPSPNTEKPTNDATKWYHCPMHVDMESTKPGKCPKCGMDYVLFDNK